MTSSQKTNINVVFGAMTFGKQGSEQSRVHDPVTASKILDIFQAHGHNEIDTARAYCEGTSETMLGELDWQKRGLVMETKYYPTAGRPVPAAWNGNLRHTPEDLRENLERSLKELGTEQVDMWYLHGVSFAFPITRPKTDSLPARPHHALRSHHEGRQRLVQ